MLLNLIAAARLLYSVLRASPLLFVLIPDSTERTVMSRLTVESINPFQQQNQVSSPLDIVLLGLRESVPYSIVVSAVHSLVIKRYNEVSEGSDNSTADDLQQFSDPLIFSRGKEGPIRHFAWWI